MTKEEIMKTYAIEQGYESFEKLIYSNIDYSNKYRITEHINVLTDLIQEELKKKIADNQNLSNRIENIILNTEIL